MKALVFHCPAPRALFRVTPAGRSLKIKSPLSSRPEVIEYGAPVDALTLIDIFKFRSWLRLNEPFARCTADPADGPHSLDNCPLAGVLNAPSVLFLLSFQV